MQALDSAYDAAATISHHLTQVSSYTFGAPSKVVGYSHFARFARPTQPNMDGTRAGIAHDKRQRAHQQPQLSVKHVHEQNHDANYHHTLQAGECGTSGL